LLSGTTSITTALQYAGNPGKYPGLYVLSSSLVLNVEEATVYLVPPTEEAFLTVILMLRSLVVAYKPAGTIPFRSCW